jgi:PAS domain S-box-containing protein
MFISPWGKMNTFLDVLVKTTIYSVTDINGNIIEVNDKFCEISQYCREELIGHNHNLINSGVNDASVFKDLWSTELSGNFWKQEVCNRYKDGTLNWYDTIITPEANEAGEFVKFYAYRTLITDKKNQEFTLKESDKDLLWQLVQLKMAFRIGM